MTILQASLLLVAALSAGLLCPVAAAGEDAGHRGAGAPILARAEAVLVEVPVGPPDPNGCRPYCR